MKRLWVPHPFGIWFIKGCGFRVSFALNLNLEALTDRRLRAPKVRLLFLFPLHSNNSPVILTF
jgi:hypothetical protein